MDPELQLIDNLTWDGSSKPVYEWDPDSMNLLQKLVEVYVSNHQKVGISQSFPLVDILKGSREFNALRVSSVGLPQNIISRTPLLKDISIAVAPLDQNLSFESVDKSEISSAMKSAILSMIAAPETLKNTTWDDIIGNEETKRLVRREFELPYLQRGFVQNASRSRGLLLYGPPGTGKTLMARAVGNTLYQISKGKEHLVKFINVKTSTLIGGLLGQTERNIAMLFEVAKTYIKGKDNRFEKSEDESLLKQSITVLFLDEIDGMTPDRGDPSLKQYQRSSTNEVLVQSGGLTKGLGGDVFLFATTNYPWRVDPAMKRRLGLEVYFSLPSPRDRIQILRLYLGKQESIKSEKLHEFLRGDLVQIAKMKEAYRKVVESLIDRNTHGIPGLAGLKTYETDFPLIISRTAFYSSADLEQLAGDLVGSGVEYGLTHWWKLKNKKWKVTTISARDPAPSDGAQYRKLVDLPPLSLEKHQPSKEAIEYVMRRMRSSVSFMELYRIEWYYLTGAHPEIPIIVSKNAGPPQNADLWTLYVYHMNLFSHRYAQEVAMQMWRVLMTFDEYTTEMSRRQCIEEVFCLSKKDVAWFSSIESIRSALHSSFAPTLVETALDWLGRKKINVPYDGVKTRFMALYKEYFDVWKLDPMRSEWKFEE
jgi:SpoVK/Ycf46/Vps4 family AAA+-type ATPase